MIHGRIWCQGCSYESCRVGSRLSQSLLSSSALSGLDLLDLSAVEPWGLASSNTRASSTPARLSLLESHSPRWVWEWGRCGPLEKVCKLRLSPPHLCVYWWLQKCLSLSLYL